MTALNIRINGAMTPEKIEAIELINKDRYPQDILGVDVDLWELKLQEVFEKCEVTFNFALTETEEILLVEEGYVEPLPDPMQTYTEEVSTYNNIKTTYELGLISEEEMAECTEYMRSIYPSDIQTIVEVHRPELFDKFKTK